MENAKIIFQQLVVMFAYIAVGYLLCRRGLITEAGRTTISNLLFYLIIPSVILNSMCVERTGALVSRFLWSCLGSVLVLGLSIAVGVLVFRRRRVEAFAAAYANAGYMGVPLILALLGTDGVFDLTAFLAIFNMLQWVVGQPMLTGDWKSVSIKKALLNPIVLCFFAGLAVFFTGLPIPGPVRTALGGIANLNGPLAMLVLGTYLTEGSLRSIFTDPRVYGVCALRLLLIPLLTAGLLYLLPAGQLRLVLLLAAAAPVGANVAIYAGKLGQDRAFAARLVCLSTLLSVFTMPLTVLLAEQIW